VDPSAEKGENRDRQHPRGDKKTPAVALPVSFAVGSAIQYRI
jgi:hypothetical protein